MQLGDVSVSPHNLIELRTSGWLAVPGESLPKGDKVCTTPMTPTELSGSAVGLG